MLRTTPRWLRAAFAVVLCSGGLLLVGISPASASHGQCTVSIDDVTQKEGNADTTSFVFAVTAESNHGSCANVSVDYATAAGTAEAGTDFTAKTGSVTFTAAEGGTQNITVAVTGDATAENDEDFFVNLTKSGVLFTDAQASGTIVNDDEGDSLPVLSVDDPEVDEADADVTGAFTLKLSKAATAPVAVDYTISAGSAASGSDYKVTNATGTVTFAAGETEKKVSFTVVGDDVIETLVETFKITLSNFAPGDTPAATSSDTEGVAAIVDDDSPSGANGYRMVAADGGIFTFGQRQFWGSTGNIPLNKPIVGGATDVSDYEGYWIVASDGGVFNFNAPFYGSLGSTPLTSPAVEIEPTPTGNGYWIVLANGKVHTFGGAEHFGDMSTKGLNKPVIGMSVAPDGKGYWLVAEDGGIFNFGSADFLGSMGDKKLNAPVIDLAPTPDGNGYYLAAKDGGVFSFGSATFWGSMGDKPLNAPVVAMLTTPSGTGYWFAASDGGVFTFGPGATFLGSMGDKKLNAPVLDLIN